MARKYKRIRYDDRLVIEKMAKQGKSVIEIAKALGVTRHGIYDEFERCGGRDSYSALDAQKSL